MKIMYYEVTTPFVTSKRKAFFHEKSSNHEPHGLIIFSDRVWSWDPETNRAELIKNRHGTLDDTIDEKEFLLIQLNSKEAS